MGFSVIRELPKWGGNNSAKLWDWDLLGQTVGAMAVLKQGRDFFMSGPLSGADTQR